MCPLMLGVAGVACALKVCPILCQKPVGIPKHAGLVCTITLGSRLDTYDWQFEMAALSRLGIRYNDLLAVQAQQVVPWVTTWVTAPVGPDRVRHGCGGQLDVRAYQVAVGRHPTYTFCYVVVEVSSLCVGSTAHLLRVSFRY